MIISFNQKAIGRIAVLLLALFLALTVFTSFNIFGYKELSKEEIQANAQQAVKNNRNDEVFDYLKDWGVPRFDQIKFRYIEGCVSRLYNYGDGLPDTLSHAKKLVEIFLTSYYDEIDLSNKTAVTDALLTCYTQALDDPYTIYRPPVETEEYITDMSGKFGGIGVLVEYNHDNESIMVNTVYIDSPAYKAGVKSGDYIYAIDGMTVEELGYLNAVYYVRGEIGSTVELTLIRDNQFVTISMIREEVEEINVDYSIDENSKIAYVQIVQFKENTYNQFVKAIDAIESAGAKGIVFDLRGNPGGYLNSVTSVISYLVPNGQKVVSYQYKGQEKKEYYTSNDKGNSDHVVDLPFVVLCNQYTASAGEIFTAAMRDYRNDNLLQATIVGTTTYKKGIMQSTYYYLDQSSITLTVAYYDPPCGINYHGKGVEPDVFVENTEGDVDLQLQVAYAEMQKLLNAN